MTRISHIALDDSGLPPPTPEIEQERKVAIYDLLEENSVDGELPEVDKLVAALFLSLRSEPDLQRQSIELFESVQKERKLRLF